MRSFVAFFGVVACGHGPAGGPNDPCSPPGEPTLEIGLGLDGYEPLADGDPIPLIHGPQGGYHLEIGLRATNVAADDLISGELVGEIDGQVLARSAPWIDLRCQVPDDDALVSWGTLLIYDARPAELDGRTTRIQAELTDLDGTVVTAEASFVIEDTER